MNHEEMQLDDAFRAKLSSLKAQHSNINGIFDPQTREAWFDLNGTEIKFYLADNSNQFLHINQVFKAIESFLRV
ncbi:hypothetical protein [Kingella negevensis]|uniref:hypothetical protein n=1 Tax=Kingella negevensis TaxID=1522312 RepID=UPI000A26A00E|nr:hypothetical protein [Kingella negevensis]WII91722.1 hypothetical protein QEO93_03835 [Kingella negevensis]